MAILWPFGDANPTRLTPTYAATIELPIVDRLTIAEVTVTGILTLSTDVDEETPDGALLLIIVTQDGTGRAITLGTGFVGDGIAGVANDVDCVLCIYKKTAGTFTVIGRTKITDAG